MPAAIHRISTRVPDTAYDQEYIRDQMKKFVANGRRSEAILHRIYSFSGIKQRHSVIRDFAEDAEDFTLFHPEKGVLDPTTGQRNDIYVEEATRLFVEAGRDVLQTNQVSPDEITHVITISCTGFFAPGPDYQLMRKLNLSTNVQRFHLGFMGCYAVFPALQMAQSFCQANENATVLIVAVELCTLHFQNSSELDNLVAASVFADGAAGTIVRNVDESELDVDKLHIKTLHTAVTEGGEDDMAWSVGDTGFNMRLSKYVPDIIESNLSEILEPLFDQHAIQPNDISKWAIHPGGRAILDKVEEAYDLDADQLQASRTVLANYGNMSSATILFVLRELMNQPPGESPETILAMAFGPGLTVETGLLSRTSTVTS